MKKTPKCLGQNCKRDKDEVRQEIEERGAPVKRHTKRERARESQMKCGKCS